jgi:uncharacterized protein (TIGR01244 family)
MNKFGKRWFFLAGFLLAMGYMIGSAAYSRWNRVQPIQTHELTPTISVSEQVSLASVANAARQGFTTIIDLRPDGEAADQPSSAEVGKVVQAQGLRFFYVPVPHGDIPDTAVAQLNTALTGSEGPVLLYCRSGKRAARTWSLVEASRPNGMEPAAILAAVKAAGQSSDDLESAIQKRFAGRAIAKDATR